MINTTTHNDQGATEDDIYTDCVSELYVQSQENDNNTEMSACH